MVEKSIAQVESVDYITLKIRKPLVLVVIGVAIVTLWLIPFLTPYVNQIPSPTKLVHQLSSKIASIKNTSTASSSAELDPLASSSATPSTNHEATTSAEIDPTQIRVRVRNVRSESEGNNLKTLLESKQYQVVDVVYESNQSYEGLQIVVKRGDELIRQRLIEDLQVSYPSISSASAELTTDSDFDAVLILGN